MSKWHDSEENRRAYGDEAEREFARRVTCHCGGEFGYVGNLSFSADFKCRTCGQEVDVKRAEYYYKSINISEYPFNHHAGDVLIVVYCDGVFTGARRRDIHNASGPYASTHSAGAKFKATRYYKIPNSNLKPVAEFGLRVTP